MSQKRIQPSGIRIDEESQTTLSRGEESGRLLSDKETAGELGQRRFPYPTIERFTHMGPFYGPILSWCYVEFWTKREKQWWRDFIERDVQLLTNYTETFNFFKKLSNILKKNPHSMHCPNGYHFMYLETFGPYFDEDVDATIADIQSWLLRIEGKRRMDNTYVEKFKESLRAIIRAAKSQTSPIDDISFEEFVTLYNKWVTAGASSEKYNWYESDKNQSTKFSTAWAKGPKFLIEKTFQLMHKEINKVSVKREKGKARAIVASDLYTYLRWAYIMYFFESRFRKFRYMNLADEDTQERLWNHFYKTTTRRNVNVPADYSGFDHQPFDEELKGFFDVLSEELSDHPLAARFVIATRDNFTNGRVTVEYRDKKWTWGSGLPSGERWTTIGGCLFNHAWLLTAYKYMETRPMLDPIWDPIIQGDDLAWWTETEQEAQELIGTLKFFGLSLNESKFYISKHRNEFLRVNIDLDLYPGHIFGYLTRALPSVFRQSLSNNPGGAGRDNDIGQIVASWRQIWKRDHEHRLPIKKFLLADLSGRLKKSGISPQTIEKWIHTPAPLGGVGFGTTERVVISQRAEAEELQLRSDNTFLKHTLHSLDFDHYYRQAVSTFFPTKKKKNIITEAKEQYDVVESKPLESWFVPDYAHFQRTLLYLQNEKNGKLYDWNPEWLAEKRKKYKSNKSFFTSLDNVQKNSQKDETEKEFEMMIANASQIQRIIFSREARTSIKKNEDVERWSDAAISKFESGVSMEWVQGLSPLERNIYKRSFLQLVRRSFKRKTLTTRQLMSLFIFFDTAYREFKTTREFEFYF